MCSILNAPQYRKLVKRVEGNSFIVLIRGASVFRLLLRCISKVCCNVRCCGRVGRKGKHTIQEARTPVGPARGGGGGGTSEVLCLLPPSAHGGARRRRLGREGRADLNFLPLCPPAWSYYYLYSHLCGMLRRMIRVELFPELPVFITHGRRAGLEEERDKGIGVLPSF